MHSVFLIIVLGVCLQDASLCHSLAGHNSDKLGHDEFVCVGFLFFLRAKKFFPLVEEFGEIENCIHLTTVSKKSQCVIHRAGKEV